MKATILATAMALLVLVGSAVPLVAASNPADAIHSVHGSGALVHKVGIPNGGNVLEVIEILAWQDELGEGYGMIAWTYTLFAAGSDPGGPGLSGWPWIIDVDTFLMLSDNEVYVEGVVINDPQLGDENVGSRVGFYVTDNGPGAADQLNGTPVRGNYIIR